MKRDSVIRIDDDDDNIARDGETVSVRVNLTDTVRFDEDGREHFVRNEAARTATRDARDEMIRRTEDAWKADARRKAKPPPDDDDDGDDGDDTIDAADHRPGFRYATDAVRAAVRDARQEMI